MGLSRNAGRDSCHEKNSGYTEVQRTLVYPDIPHNFTKKALKICQNLKLKKILDMLLESFKKTLRKTSI